MTTNETAGFIEGAVGDALSILVEIGATPIQLGQFAARYPEKIAQRFAPLQMGIQIKESKPQKPD